MVKLFHRDLGGEGRPPLVVLHGMLGSSRNWQTAGRDLAEHFHVRAPDLRNHGASPHAAEMTYGAMMDDVVAWLDAQGWERPAVMGHSMGGKVAMLLACRRPERVARLTVVDIAPKDYYWPGHRQSFAAMNELDLGDLRSRAEAELRFEARVPGVALRKFLATNLERDVAGAWRWSIHLPVLTAALPVLEKNPLTADDRYEGEVRFVTGEKSDYMGEADWADCLRHFPRAERRTVAGAGHNPHMEMREAFVRAVLD